MSLAFNYFNCTTRDLAKKVHNLNGDTLKIVLTNTAPGNTDQVLADLTEISAGNGYSAGGTAVANNAIGLSGSTASLTGDNVVFTASGGSIGPFRYLVLYNDSASNDELLGWWDYGSAVTLPDGASFSLDLSGGILEVTHP